MVKVENKETLRLLTKRFMKMNRARNIIAVIAIMLTSLLFTSLFVGSVSMILSKRATEIKQFMDSSHAIAQNLSEEDAERLQKTIEQDEDVERYGSGIFLGAGMDGGGVIWSDLRMQFYNRFYQDRHNEICSIVADDDHYLWLATYHKGIMRSRTAFWYFRKNRLSFKWEIKM